MEDKFISLLPNGKASIFMIPNETVAIPFVYQSFLSGYSQFKSADEDLSKMLQGSGIPETPIHARTINVRRLARALTTQVSFLNTKKVPVAILDIRVNPRNYYVGRVLRLFRGENENIRRTIRFANLEQHPSSEKISTIYDSANPKTKYLRCNKGDVVCSLLEGQNVRWRHRLTAK